MNKNLFLKLSVILAILLTTACGNKGDLFLPDQPDSENTEEQN